MARNKLIAKYSALNTADLPQRIYNKIQSYIDENGIGGLPWRELSGRWTGRLDISDGGWRNTFDFLYPVLRMCRVDRHGNVSPDMGKILETVSDWTDYLTTPTEDDEYIGASDETFRDDAFTPDDINEFHSAAYKAEMDSLPSWMEFIDDLRNGRYGELPEDYDGLAEPEEE